MRALLGRLIAAAVAASVAATGAAASLMDVNFNAAAETRGRPARPPVWGPGRDGSWSARDLPAADWRPGSPLYARGESPAVQAVAAGGSAVAAAAGAAASWKGAAHGGRDDKASVAGFALIALLSVLGLFQIWKEKDAGAPDVPADGGN